MWPFKRKQEVRADTENVDNIEDVLLKALLGRTEVTKADALSIPTIAGAIDVISSTIASLPIKLYRQDEARVIEIKDDERLSLLNRDTGDTLSSVQFWKALIEDYYLDKGGYAYLNRQFGSINSIHYVDATQISILRKEHPIFKDYDLYVYDKQYKPYEFFKILRKTKNGSDSVSLIDENALMIGVLYHELVYEQNMVKKGGNKKGFLKSAKKLSKDTMETLKEAYKKLYSNNSENVVVLNDGIDFQEASNTSVEMQLNENKETNANEVAKLFKMPISIIQGNATPEDVKNFIKFCITPLINDIECSLDRDLLLENEKKSYYFAFDTKELTRGNIKERYEAYEIGLKNNFLQADEVREKEDLEPLGIEWIKLGLDSVLYNPKTREIYTPNTNQTVNIEELKKTSVDEPTKEGGEEDASRIED